mgnify:CR=1 FL=1
MMVRKVDELGRIVLPVEFRKALNIGTGCDVNIELKGIQTKANYGIIDAGIGI